MPFAIVQKHLQPVGSDVLLPALQHVAWLTKHDADFLADDAFGVLVDRLSFNEASSVQAMLEDRGVETEIVDQSDLPTLPAPKHLRRMDCPDEQLVLYDALGRPKPMPWELVRVIAAGVVPMTEFERTERTRVRRAGVGGRGVPMQFTEYGSKEAQNDRLIVEILIEAMPPRYRAMARTLQYNYLGERQASTAAENFVTLVRDLRRLAPAAGVNRGAAGITQDPPQTFRYPRMHAFEEETAWLLWKAKRARSEGQ